MSFTTPKTNWVSSDYYNIEDWIRLRDNLIFVNEWFKTHNWPAVTLNSVETPRGINALPTVDLINALEQNLTLIYQCIDIPLTEWRASKEWYVRLDARYQSNPTSDDWNRWEELPKRVHECIVYVSTYLHRRVSGTFYAGNNLRTQLFSRGR